MMFESDIPSYTGPDFVNVWGAKDSIYRICRNGPPGSLNVAVHKFGLCSVPCTYRARICKAFKEPTGIIPGILKRLQLRALYFLPRFVQSALVVTTEVPFTYPNCSIPLVKQVKYSLTFFLCYKFSGCSVGDVKKTHVAPVKSTVEEEMTYLPTEVWPAVNSTCACVHW